MRLTVLLCFLFSIACKVQPSPSAPNDQEVDFENIQLSPDQAIVEFEWIQKTEVGFMAKIKSVEKAGFGFNVEFNAIEMLEILSNEAVNQNSSLAIIQKIEALNANQPMFRMIRILK
ncbi:hypothetical protein [Ekhidna sp.]|uniref:hypothetical protein n=1 Tax=Ekhidna sp. TaxID=2608089 RepID=UPI0035190311